MSCIKSIQNLVIGKIVDIQSQHASTINKPDSDETYIIYSSNENPYSNQIIKNNLGNVRSLYDGTFAEYCDKYNYVIPSTSKSVAPFIVALKSHKKILPIYVSSGEKIVIAYAKPIEVKDCYQSNGQFDFAKIDHYVEECQSSIEKVKIKLKN